MESKGCCMSYADFNFLYECSGDAIFLRSSFISLCEDFILKIMLIIHLFRSNYPLYFFLLFLWLKIFTLTLLYLFFEIRNSNSDAFFLFEMAYSNSV